MDKFYINLEDLLQKNTKEEEGNKITDFKAASNELYSRFEKHFSKNLPTEEKLMEDAITKATGNIISELGLDDVTNVDGLKAYAKKMGSTTDETKEALIRAEKEKKEWEEKYNTLNKDYSQLDSKLTNVTRRGMIVENKFQDKYIDTALLQANNMVTDELDFDSAIEKLKDTYPEWLTADTQGAGGGQSGNHQHVDGDDEEFKKWEEKYGLNK